jgi:DNA-binding transcriptional regulator LsrR (DeoR family)
MIGPDEQVRLAFVAEQYYLHDKTKVELGAELGVSRFKIARMLAEARSQGIVTIAIAAPGPIDVATSLRLQEKFGLTRAMAVATPTGAPDVVQQQLGEVAARLASEIVVDGDVLGLTAGRTLTAMARRLSAIAQCDVVQLAGVAGPIDSTGVEVIRRVSMISGGDAYSLYAPLVVSDPETAASLRRQPELQRTLAQYARVTVAFVAVGSWRPPDSELYDSTAISDSLRRRLLRRGVTAEIGAVLLDGTGAVVSDIDELCLSANADELRGIREVIGVAGGDLKTDAILASLRSGLINSLVTDVGVAERLLAA